MTDAPTHITTSGGLISVALIENVRKLSTRQCGVERASSTRNSSWSVRTPFAPIFR